MLNFSQFENNSIENSEYENEIKLLIDSSSFVRLNNNPASILMSILSSVKELMSKRNV